MLQTIVFSSAKFFPKQGCNISDIEVVIQWKLPRKLSSFIQHAGCAAQGPNTTGLAVLLVEPAAYSIQLSQPKPQNQGCSKKKQEASQASNTSQVTATHLQHGEEKDYPHSHGHFQGAWDANDTLTPSLLGNPPFSEDDESEGAYLFV